MNYIALLTALLFLSIGKTTSLAQETLSLDEAIQIGLQNNYGIEIARNTLEIAENNHTLGNAGFLPVLTGNISRSERIEDSRFETEVSEGENLGARSTTTGAGATLSWTLFDGLQMFAARDRLGELQNLGEKELRYSMEFTVNRIIVAYVNIIRITEQLTVLKDAVEVSLERIEIAETKRDLGSGSEYELLQAKNDYNTDRAAVLRETNNLVEAKIFLNELLAREAETEFAVMGEIPLNRTLSYDFLYQNLMNQNVELQLAKIEEKIADIEIRQIRSERFPQIDLTGGYNYSRNEGGGGFLSFNETQGFNVGLTARVNIFDGFNINRRVQNARINQKTRELQTAQQENRVMSEFLSAFRSYQNYLELVTLEQENLDNAEETLDIALERFRLGTISAIEFREAQRAFLAVESRLINAKYEAKLAETELLRLSGRLEDVAIE